MKNLEKLAEMVGISSEYIDKTGKTHYTTDNVRQFFLQEMGYKCESDNEIDYTITVLKNEVWLKGLDSVYAFFTDEANKKIQIYVPKSSSSITYSLKAENGRQITNNIILQNLEITEEKVIEKVFYAKYEIDVPANLECDYYTLQIKTESLFAEALVIIAPAKCYLKSQMENEKYRTFSLAVELYA